MTINPDLTEDELFDYLIQEAETNFAGWDFSYISQRYVSSPLSWSYDMKVWPKVRRAQTLLDMDTGGGEKLAQFQPLPEQTFATEAYKPNVTIAHEKLGPLGVTVVEVADDKQVPLPFDNNFFELIINRHGAFSARDIYQVMKPDGLFITQQVGDQNNRDYLSLFEVEETATPEAWNLQLAVSQLDDAGFTIIEQKENFYPARIYDVGAIVYYLKAIPWTLPNASSFTIEAYFDRLKAIHRIIQKEGYIEIGEHRFFIVAQKQPV